LIRVLPRDAGEEDPLLVARRWSNQLERLLRGKGRSSDVCVSCHMYRAKEVEAVAFEKKGR
jgi:hypothetical protein